MAEILALVAIVLAIAAMNRNGKNTAKLTEEIRKLRQELDTIRAGGTVSAARPAEGGEALAEASPGDADAAAAEPPFPSPWLRARATADEAGSATEAATPEAAAAGAETLAATATPPERESLESRIGARWAVWVGGLALALGGVFMVKYAVESGVLSPAVRLALAALFGLVLVAAGEIIRRRGQPAQAVPFGNAMIPGVLTAAGAPMNP